jgi:hypothetical protein
VTLLIVSDDRDNVGTALESLVPGERLSIGSRTILVTESVARGHKIALRQIKPGEAVLKYGSPIGIATAPIAEGAHVHTHNLASTRGRGDLAVGAKE